MAASLAALVLAASCSKAEIEVNPEEDGVGEILQGPTRTLKFNVTIGEAQTKTHLATEPDQDGSYPVLWDAQDEVKVIWGEGESDHATGKITDAATGLLEVEVPADVAVDYYYAVYPANTTYALEAETGKLTISMPERTGTFKTANLMVARCASDDRVFGFRHAVGIVRVQMGDNSFAKNGTISRFGLYSGTRSYVTGKVQCTFGENDEFSAKKIDDDTGYKYSRANNLTPGQEVYLAVWPDYTFEEGFIAYYFNEQRSAYYEGDVTVARGQILNLGNIQDRMRTDYFIKPNGTGDGSSWENAAGEAFIRSFFAKKEDSGRAYAHCQKCENTNFYFAAGTYYLGTADAPKLDLYWGNAPKSGLVPIKFYGGCAATEGTDKTRNPETYKTIFSGNSEYGILSVRNKADLTLDGITLRDAVITSELHAKDGSYGAALYVSMDMDVDNNTEGYFPVVRLNKCKFINNQEDVASSLSNDYAGGSALNLYTGKLYVNSCEFIGNVSYNRGPIRVGQKAAAGSCLFMNSCVFTGNYAKSGYGRLVWAAVKTCKFGMNNCMAYLNDSSESSSSAVGVFALNSPYVLINNTLVESTVNDGSDHGVIRTYVSNSNAYSGTIGVFGNNIVVETSSISGKVRRSIYTNVSSGYDLTTISFGNNVNTKTTFSSNSTNKTSDTDKTQTYLSELYESDDCYYWTAADDTYSYAKSSDMLKASKGNDLIGDDFYDWLVEIGAIVNGQFTDCRGFLRVADKMCPGAYDPFATSSVSVE